MRSGWTKWYNGASEEEILKGAKNGHEFVGVTSMRRQWSGFGIIILPLWLVMLLLLSGGLRNLPIVSCTSWLPREGS